MIVRRFRHDLAAARCVGARDFAGAIELYEKILDAAPNDPFALLMLVQCHDWNGDTRNAFDAAKKLQATEPNDFSSLRTLSCVFAKCGEHHTAKQYVERALALVDDVVHLGMVDTAALWLGEVVLCVKSRLFGLRHPFNKRRLVDEYDNSAHDWKTWAHDYLSWYATTYGSGSSALH